MRVASQSSAPQGRAPTAGGTTQQLPQTNLPASPHLAYRAAVAARNELINQLTTVTRWRQDAADQIASGAPKGADLTALQARVVSLDEQIATIDKQLVAARSEVVRTAGIPGATEPFNPFNFVSNRDKEYALSALFILVVLLPISLGIARRLFRRGTATAASLPKEMSDRLSRLEQSVESVAIEVERIGEGQRFMTNVLVDSVSERALGAGTRESIAVKPNRTPS